MSESAQAAAKRGYSVTEFRLPELGENIDQGDLVRLMISPGSSITEGQAVMELETDKAVVEVPSSVSGTVKEIRVREGEKVKVGQVIFTVENGASGGMRSTSPAKPAGEAAQQTSEEPRKPPSAQVPSPARQDKPGQTAPVSLPAQPSAGGAEFRLPELGENISEADVVRIMISPGMKVVAAQPVLELETEKAVVEVPSSVSGVVKEIRVRQGDKVRVGQVIFTLEGAVPAAAEPPKLSPVEHVSGQHGARLAFQAAIRAEGKTEEQALPPDQPQLRPTGFAMPKQLDKVAGSEHREPVPAAPHVRRLARELGIDIHDVKASGPGGRISDDDVKAHSKSLLMAAAAAVQLPSAPLARPELPDFSKWGKVERVSMRGVRRKTAEH